MTALLRFMAALLSPSSSIPYVVTILLGACGWGILHVIDRVTSAPSVEYCTRLDQSNTLTVHIQNLSYGQRFRNLTFLLRSNPQHPFAEPHIRGIPPAFHDQAPPRLSADSTEVQLHIPILDPGARFVGSVVYGGSDIPSLRLISAMSPVRLWPCSAFTLLLKHQIWFIVSFSAFLILASFGLLALSRHLHGPHETSERNGSS